MVKNKNYLYLSLLVSYIISYNFLQIGLNSTFLSYLLIGPKLLSFGVEYLKRY